MNRPTAAVVISFLVIRMCVVVSSTFSASLWHISTCTHVQSVFWYLRVSWVKLQQVNNYFYYAKFKNNWKPFFFSIYICKPNVHYYSFFLFVWTPENPLKASSNWPAYQLICSKWLNKLLMCIVNHFISPKDDWRRKGIQLKKKAHSLASIQKDFFPNKFQTIIAC